MSYNASVDFQDLNAQLCDLKQGAFESSKDYYDRMVDIGVALWEYHQDHFQPGELSRIEKECFFAGLRDQSKYLVSHMKDKREYGPVDMLKELRENEEARYPANTAHRPRKTDGYGRNACHPDQKGLGYIAVPPMLSRTLTFPWTLFRTRACSARTRRMLTTKGITSG